MKEHYVLELCERGDSLCEAVIDVQHMELMATHGMNGSYRHGSLMCGEPAAVKIYLVNEATGKPTSMKGCFCRFHWDANEPEATRTDAIRKVKRMDMPTNWHPCDDDL